MPRGPPVRFLRSGHLYLWADAVYTCSLGSKRPLNACLCAEGKKEKKEKERAYLKANNCVLLRITARPDVARSDLGRARDLGQ
jgi:hypothetical protein